MPKNLELKSRIHSIPWGVQRALALGARRIGVLVQIDTYFRVRSGRLKLREIRGAGSELIGYERPDRQGGRFSFYRVVSVQDPAEMKSVLKESCGIRIIVRKRRLLYRLQNARIHLDRVHGLGTFVEFEVEVTKGSRQAKQLLTQLMTAFEIDPRSSIAHSYSDMEQMSEGS